MRGNTQTMVPPAPARSPLSISLRPGPDVSAVLSQRAAASPAGPLAMKVEGNERQMEVPVCLCSVCLSCAYPLLNCPSGGPQRLQAQPWTLGQRYICGYQLHFLILYLSCTHSFGCAMVKITSDPPCVVKSHICSYLEFSALLKQLTTSFLKPSLYWLL